MSKVITVFGATGNQGGSVIKHILADPSLSKGFTIRGVTRDTSKPAAQSLSKQGVQLVKVGSAHLLAYQYPQSILRTCLVTPHTGRSQLQGFHH